MKCPNCEKELLTLEEHGLKLDICPSCKGIWFDAWEWEDLAKITNIDKENFNELVSSNNNIALDEQYKQCPTCNKRMEKIKAYGLNIDRCNVDGGIWFDGNELLKVLDVIAQREGLDKKSLEKYINQICSAK